jgi:TDG/mug DNA glycosylase family protein
MTSTTQILPDLLQPGLRAVICGTAAGRTSAQLEAYYARSNNCFWEVLYKVGLTPRKLKPQEFRELTTFRLGLTDLAKAASGVDSEVHDEAFDVAAFIASIDHCNPALVAFNGKKAARIFYGMPARAPLNYGQGAIVPNFPRVFVLPSTSGSARTHWDLEWWREFARLVEAV